MKNWLLLILLCFTATLSMAEPLPAAEVFQVNAKPLDPNTFVIHWQIKPDYFLYSNRINITAAPNAIVHLGTLRLPPSENKTDKQGQVIAVYRQQLTIPVNVLGKKPGEAILTLRYQGCADDGFCYPPEVKELKISMDDKLALSSITFEDATIQNLPNPKEALSSDNPPEAIFYHHGWVMILLLFYGFGLLLSFTPCILPMVPVLSGIIVGHGKNVTTKKAFLLSLSYVLSMSITYAIAGALVALVGANIQVSLQSPWAIGFFSLIFLALAFSMFGFYEFKLPSSWQEKIAGTSQKQRGGHYLGAAIMGCLSTLILSPCVTAPLIGVLTYIGQSGNVLFGCLTLFVLSLGMGTPLLLIGTAAGQWLPDAGSWMNTVKAFFGVMFIAVAIYLMSRLLPGPFTMALWSALFIFSGIYSGALTYSTTHTEKFYQGVGIILLGYGLLMLIGSSMGESNPLQPLGNVRASSASQQTVLAPKPIQNLSGIKQAIEDSRGKPVMIDFYADWCTSCKLMEETTFRDPGVLNTLSRFEWIKVDLTARSQENKKIMDYFHVIAPPTFIFFNSEGKELSNKRSVGELNAKAFMQLIQQID